MDLGKPQGFMLPEKFDWKAGLLGSIPYVGNMLSSWLSARRERKLAKENWNEMNAYNSPSAQMARYRAAGMNPAYASQGGFNSGNASPMPDAASGVAKVEIPNVLNTLQSYYSLKNAQLENSRLSELVTQEQLNTDALRKTHDERVNDYLYNFRKNIADTNMKEMLTGNYRKLYDNNQNPFEQQFQLNEKRYQMDFARSEREKEMFGITKQLAELDLDWKKLGINPNDNLFIRIITRAFYDRFPKMDLLKWQK